MVNPFRPADTFQSISLKAFGPDAIFPPGFLVRILVFRKIHWTDIFEIGIDMILCFYRNIQIK